LLPGLTCHQPKTADSEQEYELVKILWKNVFSSDSFSTPHGNVLWFGLARGVNFPAFWAVLLLCLVETSPLGVDKLGTKQQDFVLRTLIFP